LSIAFDSHPSRSDIEPVALALIQRRGPEVLGIARRYAVSPEDAEDAYQRALEILLTKAPATTEAELLPWLKTVVKHEAFALRRKRERDVPAEHDALDAYADDLLDAADERAERYDRLRVGAEALGRLKPQETRCLLLKAEGLSYQEIAAQTGWSYTKVNRCLVEGRRAFYARVQGIESGAECERMAPLLSALADGQASAEDMAALRPHLRGCSSCRATLRDYREAPRRVAALSPLPVAAGGVVASLADRVWSAVAGVKSLFEVKAAAVAASAVVVAGGGAATVEVVDQPPQRAPKAAAMATTPRAAAPQAAPPTVPAHALRSAGLAAAPPRAKPARRKFARVVPQAPKAVPATRAEPPTSRTPPAAAPAPSRTPEPAAPEPAAAESGDGEFGP
jgi:RNA polymerase sigma factor (sigma-70 family)